MRHREDFGHSSRSSGSSCRDVASSAHVTGALSRKTPAFIDKLFHVARIESQGTSTGSHLDRWQIWLALT
jgi:hypothetical protein